MQVSCNTTPFPAERFVSIDKQARKHCVLVVKASFDVAHDGSCRPAAEQAAFVFADQHHGDPALTSIRHESDFVPVKPRADVLLDACAVAPPGRVVTELAVALSGPGFDKPALVTGDRNWTRAVVGVVASKPQAFSSMPLTWDRAFGGSDLSGDDPARHGCEPRNLSGVGFHHGANARTVGGRPLPNVEAAGRRMRAWSDKPEPVGFGPVGRSWSPRSGFAGTYDEAWMQDRRPFLPLDFDERYFQSAPLDQQLDRLQPQMAFQCLNMSEARRFVVRLPELAVPVRFCFDDRVDAQVATPDTLILQPALRRIVLVARTAVPLGRKLAALREIQVGRPKYRAPRGKRHYAGLAEAVRSLQGFRANGP